MTLRRHSRRQNIPPVPSLAGVSGAITAATTNTASSLQLFPTETALGSSQTTDSLSPIPIDTLTSPAQSPTPSSAAVGSSSASSSSQIGLGTVVGVCVGAFFALLVLLLLVWWYIRRSKASKSSHLKPLSSAANHNVRQNKERRKSARQTWLKMRDDDEEKYAMRQPNQGVARSVTMKTYKTDKSYGAGLGLAHTFASDPVPQLEFTDPEMAGVHPPFARGAEHNPISWGGETVVHNSFLSLKSTDGIELSMNLDKAATRDDEMMSPSIVVSKQTRQATTDVVSPHHWQEAEFVTPQVDGRSFFTQMQDTDSEYSNNVVYATPDSSPLSLDFAVPENPFQSRDPFDDDHAIANSSKHVSVGSLPSGERGNRAMQSLLNALAISEDDAKERLAAATQPTPRASVQSVMSSNTIMSAGDDAMSVSKFPMPPGH